LTDKVGAIAVRNLTEADSNMPLVSSGEASSQKGFLKHELNLSIFVELFLIDS